MPLLSDKLKALGLKLGAQNLPPPQPRREVYAVEQVIPGRFQATPEGEIFVAEKIYPPTYQHGQAGLQLTAPPHLIAAWAGEPAIARTDLAAFAFLDTETTGLAGGTGSYAFLIGLGRYEGDHFRLAQFFMRDPTEEAAQLTALAEFLQPSQILVTFNGKAFDAPLLNTRYLIQGQPSPLANLAHLDLLHLARRLWRDRLPSRTLGQLELHILEATRTDDDIPGWLIPTVYFDYLRSGDARPLKNIFYHNAMDVLAMAALLGHIAQLLDDPFNGNVKHTLDLVAIAKLFESLGRLEAAMGLYQHALTQNLPEESYWDTLRRLSLMQRRQGNWAAALELWQQAAAGRQIYAHVELAKHYEHQVRDYHQALHWTETALALVRSADFPRSQRGQWLGELKHRRVRLQRKLDQA